MRVQDAISVIETDCEVDFAAPLDYVEPQREERPVPAAAPSSSADAAGLQSRPRSLNTVLVKLKRALMAMLGAVLSTPRGNLS